MAALNGRRASGTLRLPGDKSISHRALILAALARGKSRVRHVLESDDVQSTARSLRALGADIPPLSDDFYVTGRASRLLRAPIDHLDCGNSGTTARLMAGVIAGTGLTATFVGDGSLSRRPMARVAEPLRRMGARVELAPHGGLPMTVRSGPLHPLDWGSNVASAQVKSAVLLAALLGGVSATVREPHPSRDHTERMLAARGVALRRNAAGTRVDLEPGQILRPADVDVPSDPSAAAFFVALALLSPHAKLRLAEVCLNPTRTGFLDVARDMGGRIEAEKVRDEDGEPIGDLVVESSSLRGLTIAPDRVPSMIDELPLFACMATRAQGISEVSGAAELRVKESDRIAAVVANLRRLGADADELADGFRVRGPSGPLRGRVETMGDHRIAMSFAILGAIPGAGNQIEIDDRDCVAVSYPGFWADLAGVSA